VAAVDTFIGDGNGSTGLIAITDQALLIADVEPAVAAALAKALADGALVDLPAARRIPLAQLTSVQTNQRGTGITLRHWDGKTTQLATASFTDGRSRDRALAVLQRRFGPGICRQETQFGLFRAVGLPLLAAIGIALFSWVVVGAAQELRGGAPVPARHAARPSTALFAAVLMLIGPVGAAIIGALATGAALRWTYLRWRQPPLTVRLFRG
jgi:hypothetical protein